MANHAYVIIAIVLGAPELYVAVAESEEEARDTIARRKGARAGEDVSVAAVLRDDTAQRIGADLLDAGSYANFVPGR